MRADYLDRIPLRVVPDLGGLPVSDAGGRPVGKVYGGLAEADTGLLRYLDVSLESLQRHILIPIGHTRIRQQDTGTDVRLRAAVLADLEKIPTYHPEEQPVDDGYEREVLAAYGRTFYGDRYYAHPAFDHGGLYAGEHPIVHEAEAVPTRPVTRARLLPLSQAKNYRLAKGEPDVIGWELMTDADLPSGEVSDLVVDLEDQQVRYVIVEVADGEGAVPLPVGFLVLDERRRRVRATGLRHDDLAALPRLGETGVTRKMEDAVHDVLRGRFIERRRYSLPDFGAGRLTDRRRS